MNTKTNSNPPALPEPEFDLVRLRRNAEANIAVCKEMHIPRRLIPSMPIDPSTLLALINALEPLLLEKERHDFAAWTPEALALGKVTTAAHAVAQAGILAEAAEDRCDPVEEISALWAEHYTLKQASCEALREYEALLRRQLAAKESV